LVRTPRLTSPEAEGLLLKNGFELIRTKGSHRIYIKGNKRIIIPFHKSKILHPKIIKQILRSINN
jgi:predicted RNA binding protein YcfA (HicA-like mRNA interferase family)